MGIAKDQFPLLAGPLVLLPTQAERSNEQA
jgi:hypothetical protein